MAEEAGRHPSEEDDLSRALSGDSAAWTRLVNRYASLVYGTARRTGLGEEEAADVSQEVWIELWQRGGAIREAAALPRWLAVVSRRKALRAAERRRAAASDPLSDSLVSPDTSPDELVQREDRAEAVRSALDALPPRCRKLLIVLFRSDRPDYAEVARRLKMPVGSIGPTRARCLARLYRRLQERGFEP